MTKFVILTLFLISTSLGAYYLVPIYQSNEELKRELDRTELYLLEQQEEIAKKRKLIDDLNRNPAAIDKVAREKFGLCRERERVYKFTDEDKLREQLEK
ncbi:MAG: septum formation initiator family protein [Lentisphaerales bacterium]|nr:septum formation initiator family protein [Lentisphaerales bacterium]